MLFSPLFSGWPFGWRRRRRRRELDILFSSPPASNPSPKPLLLPPVYLPRDIAFKAEVVGDGRFFMCLSKTAIWLLN